jgi:pyruvate,water dikinase
VLVLPGLIIPVEVFDAYLTDQVGDVAMGERSQRIRSGTLPPDLAGELREQVAKLGSRVVVRSSGLDEDGAEASWAGQYETVFGVRPGDETEAAVLACWASAFDERALAYQSQKGRNHRPRMAVLIQPVVEPRCAGVMFTINPLTGSWREMTVEAAWGQAVPVVQGEVVPDYHVVRRPRKCPRPIQKILARVQLEVTEDLVRPQTHEWILGQKGLDVVEVPPARVEAPKLRHAELLRLCRLGLKVEALMGGPQDLEWALEETGRFVVLQSRPVTSGASVRRTGPALWTRKFIGERWTEPATPLGWSMMKGLIDGFIGYPETQRSLLGGGPSTKLVRFAPYLNVTMFRHLAFKLPGAPPPRFMMELLPAEEQRGWLRRHAQAPDFGVYLSVLGETFSARRWQQFSPGLWSNPREWDAFLERLDEQLPVLEKAGVDAAACLAMSDRCRALAQQYIGVHVCSLLWANVLHELSGAALKAGGHEDLIRDALRPTEQSWTVKTNHALWRLGRGELSMTEFLADYGHRAASSWELFSPRWTESHGSVQVLAEVASQHDDPSRLAASQAERARSALGALGGWLGKLVSITQTYLLLREDQRFHFDRLLWVWGVQLRALEQHLGLEVRFLEKAELDGLVCGDLDRAQASARIEERKELWTSELDRRAKGDEPPVYLVGAEALIEQVGTTRLQGTGASPGVVTGTVRVLRSPEDGERLQSGDILVARATDPGWTPLFLKAGGVIMELGGMLSHGAVVAREYGLPAVVNITGATSAFKDGQVVTIDGQQGVVWVVDGA